MDVFRCRICTEPCLESVRPMHCPFCGARQEYIVPAEAYEPNAIAELSDKSRESLQKALAQQVDNSQFYRGASKVADDEEGAALFAAMAAQEARHAEIVCRILGLPAPEELRDTGSCSPSHKENRIEAGKRQTRLSKIYSKFLEDASEEGVREVLKAFIEIENDHLGLAG
ncbi:MAG: ferritin family protein [Desulfuromonadales bacterium]|uniref:ferritin family protein n=1 Tax=Desulfuromonas sp. KJ2020 TaxID=2919173 RepID=UPI0020A7A7DD|nr:ferritin family protein [Desulfuromonas sp. KJ2020]MCP3177218.1 hypothetical protein [Desulfuromonas sp. KJ2020]